MSAQIFYNNGSSSSEIITHLVNASDGQGLHFNGTDGNIDIASPPDLGTKFSMEFIVQADAWGSADQYLVDFGTGGRFIIFSANSETYNLAIYSVAATASFGVKVLDDLKVHHLVVTVDGTAAVLYDNGNHVATATITSPNIDSCTDARIGSNHPGSSDFFNGTFYRARFWNKTLSQTDVTSVYESASVPSGQLGTTQAELIANGNFASAAGWTLGTGWTVASNKATSDGSQTGNSNIYRTTAQTVVLGKNYRVTFTVSGRTAGEVWVNVGGNTQTTKRSTNGTFTEEVVTGGGVTNHIYIQAGPNFVGSVTDLTVTESGCSVDLDLAFANPTQSTIIQDRAGVADGTAAGGVTQISPIEAVNTNKLNVGGTTPLVGIGVPPGSIPTVPLEVYGNIRAQVSNAGGFYLTNDTGVVRNNATGVAVRTGTSGGTDRLIVDTAGNVGVGCTPSVRFEVEDGGTSSSVIAKITADDGNPYALEIGNDTYSTTDGQGLRLFVSDAGATTIVAADNGTSAGLLRFRTDETDRLSITSAGTTWVSADGFASAYHTGADAAIAPIHNGTTRPGIRIFNINDGTASQTAIQFKRDGATVGSITTTDSATAYNTSSDYRLKENVTELTGALDRLDSIPVYNFNFKSDPTKTVDGFLAHEVSEFVPEAIQGEKDEMETVVVTPAVAAVEAVAATIYAEGDELPEGKAIGDEKTPAVEAVEAVAEVTEEQPKYQGIDQSKLVPLLVAAVKELKAKVTALENA